MTMRFAKNNKGQMRIIETIIAIFIIVIALTFVNFFALTPKTPGLEVSDLDKMGYSVLHDLDQQGLLAPEVYGHGWADLNTVLRMSLPVDVSFNMTIYNLNGDELNPELIFSGDDNTFSGSKNVASIPYCLVGCPKPTADGFAATYEPIKLVLLLTRG